MLTFENADIPYGQRIVPHLWIGEAEVRDWLVPVVREALRTGKRWIVLDCRDVAGIVRSGTAIEYLREMLRIASEAGGTIAFAHCRPAVMDALTGAHIDRLYHVSAGDVALTGVPPADRPRRDAMRNPS